MDLPVVGRVDLPFYGDMQGKMTAGSVELYYDNEDDDDD